MVCGDLASCFPVWMWPVTAERTSDYHSTVAFTSSTTHGWVTQADTYTPFSCVLTAILYFICDSMCLVTYYTDRQTHTHTHACCNPLETVAAKYHTHRNLDQFTWRGKPSHVFLSNPHPCVVKLLNATVPWFIHLSVNHTNESKCKQVVLDWQGENDPTAWLPAVFYIYAIF